MTVPQQAGAGYSSSFWVAVRWGVSLFKLFVWLLKQSLGSILGSMTGHLCSPLSSECREQGPGRGCLVKINRPAHFKPRKK